MFMSFSQKCFCLMFLNTFLFSTLKFWLLNLMFWLSKKFCSILGKLEQCFYDKKLVHFLNRTVSFSSTFCRISLLAEILLHNFNGNVVIKTFIAIKISDLKIHFPQKIAILEWRQILVDPKVHCFLFLTLFDRALLQNAVFFQQ